MSTTTGIIPKIIYGHMAAFGLFANTDYRIFKKLPGERKQLKALKKENKDERIIHYGSPENAKKFLNVPERQIIPPMEKISF